MGRIAPEKEYERVMRILATITRPTEGRVLWNETDIVRSPDGLRAVLGYLPQDFGVYPRVSAYEMLDHMAVLKGISSAADRRTTVETLLSVRQKLTGASQAKVSHNACSKPTSQSTSS